MQLLSEHNDCMYMIMMCSWTLCEGGGQDFCDRLSSNSWSSNRGRMDTENEKS
jgi:hypothetical protein